MVSGDLCGRALWNLGQPHLLVRPLRGEGRVVSRLLR